MLMRRTRQARPTESLALVTSLAHSIPNFRGPLIRELVSHGVRVYALAPDYDERTRECTRGLGAIPVDISLDRTGMRPMRDAWDFLKLVGQLRSLKPDAVLAYFVKPAIYGSLAAWLARVPKRFAMVEGLGYTFTVEPGRQPLRRRALRWITAALFGGAFRVCDRVFFLNDDDASYFATRRLIEPAKVVRLSAAGVDLEEFQPAPPVTRPIVFLLMARLLREKGICEYAEAARLVKADHPDSRFLLLGGFDSNPGGLSRAEVEQWVREGIIEWPGHIDDVRPWIARASVFVLPSYREGLPRSTQEAMAMGRPVITTDAVGCRETVQEGVNGFLVPVRDVKALARAMRRMIEEPELIARMGRESRRLAEERFDVRRINAEILDAIGIRRSSVCSLNATAAARRGIFES